MKCRRPLGPRAGRVRLLLMDVDGVLTDGRIRFIEDTQEMKVYDARDGVGLSIARRIGLRTGVISGRGGAAVIRRAEELGIHEVHLRVKDKLLAYERILRRQRVSDAQVCYIGDDLTDLAILGRVGMPVAVADAHSEVLKRVLFVTRARGGRGAVREVIDALVKARGRWREVLGWYDPAGSRPERARGAPSEEEPR
jgi:3-deoxy-D-manno-octulosonate 8-phosphate phosphatase (KDO 8-P phosphatase)